MKFNKFLAITMLAVAPSAQYASSAMVKTARSAGPLAARLGASSTVAPAVGSSVASSPLAGQARNYIAPSYFDANKKAIASKAKEAIDKYDIFNDNDTSSEKDINALKQQEFQARKLKDEYWRSYNDLRTALSVKPTYREDTYSLLSPGFEDDKPSDKARARDEKNIQQAGRSMKEIETSGTINVKSGVQNKMESIPAQITPEMKSKVKSKLEAYKEARAAVDKFLAANPEPTQENPEPSVTDDSKKS